MPIDPTRTGTEALAGFDPTRATPPSDDSADWYDPNGEYPQICPVCSDAEFTLQHCDGGRSFCECECTSA